MSNPQPYRPSDTAAIGPDDKRAIVVTISVSNTSGEVLHGYDWIAKVTADGTAGDQVFDSGSSGGPSEPPDILPGKTGSWRVVLGLPTAGSADIVLSLSWGLAEPIYWEGQA
ncbi:hypothetical protein [Amycolatopsis sp. cmx-8-4]|uniref:hypothetical protein n=1 Tax=Amycolatopsis sp. cmx-8-4 TaxID=2790947 RepID=UPI00397E58FD